MLIVCGGLPGVGKTTISRTVAHRKRAVYLRVDTIEQAIRAAGVLSGGVGAAGYNVAVALAAENLAAGRLVIADCVNPVIESRMAWRATAERAGARLIEVEVICSDLHEHRRRIELRLADIPGHTLPNWQAVVSREYAAWDRPRLIIDTAVLTADEAVSALERTINRWCHLPLRLPG